MARIMPAVVIAFLAILWFLSRFAPETALKLCAVFVLITLFMYFTLWIYKVFPSCVVITEKGISQSVTTEDEVKWKFETLDHCEITSTTVDGSTLRMLIIETKKGNRSMLGIADSVSTEVLQQILTGKGVKVLFTSEKE